MRRMLEDLRMEATPADDLARPAPPQGGGRRIASPKGDHRRPPAFYHLRVEAGLLCFVDKDVLWVLGLVKEGYVLFKYVSIFPR